jgi:hypothetical protein
MDISAYDGSIPPMDGDSKHGYVWEFTPIEGSDMLEIRHMGKGEYAVYVFGVKVPDVMILGVSPDMSSNGYHAERKNVEINFPKEMKI